MLKYLKHKPVISVLVIVALAMTVLGILLTISPSGKLPPTSQECTHAETMSQTSTTRNSSSGVSSASQTDNTVSSASITESTAKSNSSAHTTATVKTAKNTAITKATAKTTTKAASKTKPTTTAASTPESNFANFQADVIVLVNKERTNRGLKALSGNIKLSEVATIKSQDMADLGYFNHTSPTYGSPFDMMKQFGINYKTAGENIAMGQTTPKQVMNSWMNSEGHRANILNAAFKQIGIGIAKDSNNRIYWTQMFIG